MIEKIKYKLNKISKFINRVNQLISIYLYKNRNKEFEEIIKQNRKYLKSIDSFLTKKQFLVNDYGIPKDLYNHLDKPINIYPTYTDLLIFLSNYLKKDKLNYLEIGVSVMKNYLQIANQFTNSKIFGFDNNPINPNFVDIFDTTNTKFFNSTYKSNDLYYFCGDLLDQKDTKEFKSFANTSFDIIFSDALHTKEGVMSEYSNLIKGSLSESFILYFDDLDFPDLKEAVIEIYNDLSLENKNLNLYSFDIHGWVGQHEKFHTNGIITDLDLQKKFRDDGIVLKKFRRII